MRKCRNWQTSKTKDLVSNALVWVQVPSSAVHKKYRMPGNKAFPVLFLLLKYWEGGKKVANYKIVISLTCSISFSFIFFVA